jgi:hypothetical protein
MWYLGDNFYPLLHTAHWFLSVTNEDQGKARVLSYIVNMGMYSMYGTERPRPSLHGWTAMIEK